MFNNRPPTAGEICTKFELRAKDCGPSCDCWDRSSAGHSSNAKTLVFALPPGASPFRKRAGNWLAKRQHDDAALLSRRLEMTKIQNRRPGRPEDLVGA